MSAESQSLPAHPAVFWPVVAAATALGAALRLVGLGEPSLWVDEFFTIARAGVDPLHWSHELGYLPSRVTLWWAGADLGRIGLENITEWQALGVTERAARLGPCGIGIASIPALAVLARFVVGPAVAGAAALLLALLPYHIYWSQMARYYTAEFLLANAFLLLFARAMQTGRTGWFAAAAASGLLAFGTHFTAIFIIGGCLGLCVLTRLARVPLPHLTRGLVTLALTTGACLLTLAVKELEVAPGETLAAFASQDWSASVPVLVLGAILRFEPVICAVGLGTVWLALRTRSAFWLLVSAIAVLVPIGVLSLKLLFPVGPRYIFSCAFAWILLASAWCAEVERRLRPVGGKVLGATGLVAVLVAVSFNTYLYVRDGTGARARWSDAYEYVLRHGDGDDPVYYEGPGRFHAAYYLERSARPLPDDAAALPPGSWIVHRSRGEREPRFGAPLEVKARYEIPSKPWSWVLRVARVPPG